MIATLETDSALDLAAFTQRYAAAWNSCDTDLIAELVTEDIVWADPALSEPAVGIPAVQEFIRTSFRTFPDLHFPEPEHPHLSVEGDQVSWAWSMEGTMRGHIDPPGFAPTGVRFRVDGVDLWTMEGGRIARYRAFYDLNDLVRQLGILPPAGSRAERVTAALQRLQVRLSGR